MKNALFFCLLTSFVFSSCKKTEDAVPENIPVVPAAIANNFPLSTGSYWIYERFNMDTNGVETTLAVDSSYISGDTVMHSDTFAIITGDIIDPASKYYRRDSSGYLIDQFGIIHCSNVNYADTLWSGSTPGYYTFYYRMMPGAVISTPAGALCAHDYQGTVNVLLSSYAWDNPRYLHSYYSDGIGLIRETSFFLASPNYIGRKLVRYHIE